MAFRADEAERAGFEEVVTYFAHSRDLEEADRKRSRIRLSELLHDYGPVVDGYPTWHPLVCHQDSRSTETLPGTRCGYRGLDHTRYLANGFITCPYGDGQEVLDSVADLPPHFAATITARKLDVKLYHPGTTPILVTCDWGRPLNSDGTIPLSLAMPLILEHEVPCWRWSEAAETWESMRPYLLGRPHGSRSSLFINQESGQAIKKIWEAMIYTGMFGRIKV